MKTIPFPAFRLNVVSVTIFRTVSSIAGSHILLVYLGHATKDDQSEESPLLHAIAWIWLMHQNYH